MSMRAVSGVTRFLTSAPNEFVADMIYQRLTEAGVQPLSIGSEARPASLDGGRDIYVEDQDLDRARQILRRAESVSEQELSDESQGAVQQARPAKAEPTEFPVPKRSAWKRLFGVVIGRRYD
jgi:hypothetical protein